MKIHPVHSVSVRFEEFASGYFHVFGSVGEHLGYLVYYKKKKCFIWLRDEKIILSSEQINGIVRKIEELEGHGQIRESRVFCV
jgi:hypothetical protein